MTELHHLTLAELNEGLRARRFSSIEITKHYLSRIERMNPALNAVITVTGEQALAAAQRADRLLASGEAGALAGLAGRHNGIFFTPWDLKKVPGGSSGGSAASVAARIPPAATATDTGGSIRQPAALTGLTGFKPTYGRVSRYGMIAFASSLDQAGTLTLSAKDAALLMRDMAGFHPKDSTSVDTPVPD